jgi:hypothetical protein
VLQACEDLAFFAEAAARFVAVDVPLDDLDSYALPKITVVANRFKNCSLPTLTQSTHELIQTDAAVAPRPSP